MNLKITEQLSGQEKENLKNFKVFLNHKKLKIEVHSFILLNNCLFLKG